MRFEKSRSLLAAEGGWSAAEVVALQMLDEHGVPCTRGTSSIFKKARSSW
jgi:hypothetical protein